ncbi:hypothetical protein L914_10937 [Phytophthora nicotianae]|uniref:Uncharacterized protein n=1 Tax=Phytophthora nicotianae TaxID=4792 RepID=W2N508_PHYNI|nr:hypothetical protein L914_10937 [Phytophthora nicotianae]
MGNDGEVIAHIAFERSTCIFATLNIPDLSWATPIDARDLPVEWIIREYQRVRSSSCGVQEIIKQTCDKDEEQHMIEEGWWGASKSFAPPAQQLPFTISTVDCATQPLNLGCDGLLVVLTAILTVLLVLKATMHSVRRRAE